jgi:hypothetical protein
MRIRLKHYQQNTAPVEKKILESGLEKSANSFTLSFFLGIDKVVFSVGKKIWQSRRKRIYRTVFYL